MSLQEKQDQVISGHVEAIRCEFRSQLSADHQCTALSSILTTGIQQLHTQFETLRRVQPGVFKEAVGVLSGLLTSGGIPPSSPEVLEAEANIWKAALETRIALYEYVQATDHFQNDPEKAQLLAEEIWGHVISHAVSSYREMTQQTMMVGEPQGGAFPEIYAAQTARLTKLKGQFAAAEQGDTSVHAANHTGRVKPAAQTGVNI